MKATHSPQRPCAGSGEPESRVNGILVVDKPEGLTSLGVVKKVQKMFRLKKVGHCGTLDPFATGVLLVCANQATRIADQFLDQGKAYRFTIRLGEETETQDLTGSVTRTYDGPPCSEADLREVIDRFRGVYRQSVPRFAAVKIQGRRLYKLSRKGVEVDLPSREVSIYRLDLISFAWPEAVLEASCSKGTYIRQLASDIGEALGCGAHVRELRRLSSGAFRIDQAVSLEELESEPGEGGWKGRLVSMSAALVHLPSVPLEDELAVRRLCSGCVDAAWEAELRERFRDWKGPVRIVAPGDDLIALWWPNPEEDGQRRLRVLQTPSDRSPCGAAGPSHLETC